jgi:uncharacterized protein (TIGR03437 family)
VRARGAELAAGHFTISARPRPVLLNPAHPSQPGAVENQDYSVNSENNPAKIGSIVQIFATGYGNLDAAAPTQVFLAGVQAQVAFSGLVAPGLWQINAVVPGGISGQLPLFVAAGSTASNAVTIYLQ